MERFKKDPVFTALYDAMIKEGHSPEEIEENFLKASSFVDNLFETPNPEKKAFVEQQMSDIANGEMKAGPCMMKSDNITLISEVRHAKFREGVDPLLITLLLSLQQNIYKSMKMAIVADLQDAAMVTSKLLEFMQKFVEDHDLTRELTDEERKELDNG